MLAGGIVDEPVDAPAHAEHPPGVDVVDQKLGRIADGGGVLGREQTLLRGCHLEEVVTDGASTSGAMHKPQVWLCFHASCPTPRCRGRNCPTMLEGGERAALTCQQVACLKGLAADSDVLVFDLA